MAAKESLPSDVDIDPGWYPGQPELEDGPEAANEPLSGEASAGPSYRVARSLGAGGLINPISAPTVLTKLQKWGDYESVGAQVLPTKFIPMKTPLSAEILDSWSLPSQPKHRLTVPEMVAQQAALGRKVGLLLDLSNHDCLYAADIPPGLAYTHVQLVAKELPPPEFVDAVVAVANRFWARNPDEYIAVHCAYGFNRTGFVVCCYLIECCGLSVEDALAAFADSRPPGVKHEQFRLELHRRYSHGGAGLGGLAGSPDDNSSFGYSPSCGSLDLRDMCCGGGSPVPGLGRGSTFDCVLAPHHSVAMAAAAVDGGGSGGGAAAGAGSPCAHRRSLDGHQKPGHQTLTFTSSSFVRRVSSSGGGGQKQTASLAAAAAGRPLQPLPRSPESQQQAKTEAREEQVGEQGEQGEAHRGAQQGSRGEQGSRAESQAQAQGAQRAVQALSQCADEARGQVSSGGGGQHGTLACTERQDAGREAGQVSAEPAAPASDGCGSDEDSNSRAAMMQRQPSCNDNESLGVNDRQLLQTLRQQALAQMSATIPEESGSVCSTPARGCSSLSLADCDSNAGHSTPRPAQLGRYSHKSLDTIDWGAAAAAETSGDAVANGAGPPVPAFEAMKLG